MGVIFLFYIKYQDIDLLYSLDSSYKYLTKLSSAGKLMKNQGGGGTGLRYNDENYLDVQLCSYHKNEQKSGTNTIVKLVKLCIRICK